MCPGHDVWPASGCPPAVPELQHWTGPLLQTHQPAEAELSDWLLGAFLAARGAVLGEMLEVESSFNGTQYWLVHCQTCKVLNFAMHMLHAAE